jgi:hypothetical protein
VEDDYLQIAGTLFRSIASEFKWLQASCFEQPNPQVDLELVFDKQPGLVFQVAANLQGDELHLHVGEHFWCEWFPCSRPKVVSRFGEALRGVLSGKVRLVEYSKGGRIIKAELQQEDASGWRTVATSSKLRWPSLQPAQTRIQRNPTA